MTQKEHSAMGRVEGKLDKLLLGMYGDEDNKIPGLIERQGADESWKKEKGKIIERYLEHKPTLDKIVAERNFVGKYWWFAAVGAVGVLILVLQKLSIFTL